MSRSEFNPHPVKLFIIESLARRLPSCDRTTHTISASFDRRLTIKERILKRLHLSVCVWCTRYSQQVGLIRDAMHKREELLPVPDSGESTHLTKSAYKNLQDALDRALDEGK